MTRVTRITVLTIVIFIGMVGALTYFHLSLRRMRIGFLTPADVRTLMEAAERARGAVAENRTCVFGIDDSSIGDQGQEAKMLYLAAMLDLYRVKFGRTPATVAELDRLRTFDKANALDVGKLDKECSIYPNSGGASVITCGTWRPSSDDLAALTNRAGYVQMFYRVGDHEVLYVPAPRC